MLKSINNDEDAEMTGIMTVLKSASTSTLIIFSSTVPCILPRQTTSFDVFSRNGKRFVRLAISTVHTQGINLNVPYLIYVS